jgi:fructose-specific component phosphotransferase system IIB-like protein
VHAIVRLLVAMLAVIAVSSCAGIGSYLAPRTASSFDQDVVMDQRLLTAHITVATGKPTIDRDRAIALATPYVTNAAQADSVIARYVQLTLNDPDGGMTSGIHDRLVWLVTFRGVTYSPVTTSASTCACGSYYQRPNTAVALDAVSGKLVVSFGVD